jgi:hypothetical protein
MRLVNGLPIKIPKEKLIETEFGTIIPVETLQELLLPQEEPEVVAEKEGFIKRIFKKIVNWCKE